MRYRRFAGVVFLSAVTLFVATVVHAAVSPAYLFVGVGYDDVRLFIVRIVQIIWILGGLVAGGFLIYGFVLLRRNPDDLLQRQQGRTIVQWSAASCGGIVLILVITGIIYALIEGPYRSKALQTDMSSTDVRAPFSLGTTGGDFQKIRSHYPTRNERNISRNVSILITFKDDVRFESIATSNGELRKDSVRIFRTLPRAPTLSDLSDARVFLAQDKKTIKITPAIPLGEEGKKTLVTVALTSAIQKASGEPLFELSEGYIWEFEVSGLLDNTPPFVETFFPFPANKQTPLEKNPINALVQVTFNEPVDPASIRGSVVTVQTESSRAAVEGSLSFSNNFRTVTFMPHAACGLNSCSENIYCFPKQSLFSVRVKAASLAQALSGSGSKARFPYDGITDLAGNSFDGGGSEGRARDGLSAGSPKDDFTWSFATSDQLDTTPLLVSTLTPGRDATRVLPQTPIDIQFSKFIDVQFVHQGSIVLDKTTPTWFEIFHASQTRSSRVRVQHEPLKENTLYSPVVRSELHDMFQNCYNPCLGPLK